MGTHFEKVSYEQFIKDCEEWEDNPRILEEFYNNIKLPKRATYGSAGYDFFAPYNIIISPHDTVKIPTGIRWIGEDERLAKEDIFLDNLVLLLYPRSGSGFKYGLRLHNTCGVIDQSYFLSDNEGHIMVKLHNPSDETIEFSVGQGFCQGLIMPFCITSDDMVTTSRNGGFGSTDR